MKNIYFISIAIVLFSFSSLSAQTLLAEYPLLSDGVDISGNNAEMTILEAPFQNGGIYSNGIYNGNDTMGSYIQSPQIADFNFDDLTVKVDFLLDEYPEHNKPIIMLGSNWRWMSAWMDESKIALKVNNGSYYEISDAVVSLNQWHTLSVSYNKAEAKAELYLDFNMVLSIDVEELNHHENGRITNLDGGIGKTYLGYWKNLRIYNSSVVAKIDENLLENIYIRQLRRQVQVDVPTENNGTVLRMFDLSGRSIGEYKLKTGTNTFTVQQAKQLVLFVLDDQKGHRLTQKIYIRD
jgi:hypothetical protein